MQISIRELKANPARAIALTQQGQRVQITSHRKVVAELVAPGKSEAAPRVDDEQQGLERLLASGLVAEPATQPMRLGPAVSIPPGADGQTLGDLVIELRGPR